MEEGNFTPWSKTEAKSNRSDGGGSWRTEYMSRSISSHMKLWWAISQWFSFNKESTFYTYHHHYSGFILLSSQCSGATLLVLSETISPCSLHGLFPTSVQRFAQKQTSRVNERCHYTMTHHLTYLQKLSLPEAKIKWVLNSNDLGYLSAYFKRWWKGLQSTNMFYLESSCPTRCSAQGKWLAPKDLLIQWEPSQQNAWHTVSTQ